jgi:hypothetical protein
MIPQEKLLLIILEKISTTKLKRRGARGVRKKSPSTSLILTPIDPP